MSLSVLAFLVSIGTAAGLVKLGASAIDAEAQVDEAEEVATAEDGEITIELGDTPVFKWIESTVTVTEDMPAGYTLKAYSENSTLSSEGTDKTISMVTIPEDGLDNAGTLATALTDNTWGLAVEEPESETQEIYFSLPSTAEEAITIATVEDMEAEGSDTVTVYYGVYVTPDMPYGTYTGASVNYEVEANAVATVTFDGNGLYFNNDESQTTNILKYIPGNQGASQYSHTPNVNDEGIQDGKYGTDLNETFVYSFDNVTKVNINIVKTGNDACWTDSGDYFSIWSGSHSDYTALNDWGNEDSIKALGSDGKYVFGMYNNQTISVEGSSITIAYTTSSSGPSCGGNGYGYYAIVTGYNPNVDVSGEYVVPGATFAHNFLGWSKEKTATSATYANQEDISSSLDLTDGDATLYAIWQPTFQITYNGNDADTTTNMDNVEQYTTNVETASTVDLLASNFTREGYGFAGWSTDAEAWTHLTDDDTTNDPTIYGPNQTITIDENVIAEAGENRKLVLSAVWAPAEQNNGAPVYLQNWTGCSSLTATTYNNGVLTVGKNTITALTDARDGNVYTVAKLADGNCWTVENLKLDNSDDNTTTSEFSSTNTNNPSLPLTNNYAEQTTSNRLSATSNDWCINYNSAPCYDQSKLNTNNTALAATSPAFSQDFTSDAHNKNLDTSIASYGNYYNWYSATAGNGKQETSSNVTVAGDICPTGWHLPYGGSSTSEKGGNTKGGFYYLNKQMGGNTSSTDSNNWRSFPNNFVYSGNWNGSSASVRGSYGYYWSSTAYGTLRAYYLYFDSGYVFPGTSSYNKGNGFSVRCVAPVE